MVARYPNEEAEMKTRVRGLYVVGRFHLVMTPSTTEHSVLMAEVLHGRVVSE